MKTENLLLFALALVSLLTMASCPGTRRGTPPAAATVADGARPITYAGRVYLYGEAHGVAKILDAELALWVDFYQNRGMRHLFVEQAYYTGEFLNLWMKADDDAILEALYEDWRGTASHNPDVLAFYRRLKRLCPDTVFHGTDVGHQYDTTGARYLRYLEENGLRESERYALAVEAVRQGRAYYATGNDVSREMLMAANFKRELGKVGDADVMGIYGSAHTGLDALDFTGSVPCMAKQLKASLGSALRSEDLSELARRIEAVRVDRLRVRGREYAASYFGKQDMSSWSRDFSSREFWRLEGAYDDLKAMPKNGNVLPYGNYPMLVEPGQVFAVDYAKADGTVSRIFYRSDGAVWKGAPTTEEFDPGE